MKKKEEYHKIKCILYPGLGVGPFRYGDELDTLVKTFNLEQCERAFATATWETWEVCNQEVQLYLNDTDKEERDGLIGIGCFDHLYYRGKNLFGLGLHALSALLGKEDEIDTETYNGRRPVEYDNLGIQVWLNDQGLCDSVMCSEVIPEENQDKLS